MIVVVACALVALAALILHLKEEKSKTLALEKVLPVYKVESDLILSKHGDVTCAYKLDLPEIFTLSNSEYDTIHQIWLKAMKVLPAGTIIHKQDWFCKQAYQPPQDQPSQTFLAQKSNAYFTGRPFLAHSCYLMLTRKAANRKPASSVFSNLLRPLLHAQPANLKALGDFVDKAGQFQKLLSEGGFIKVERMKDDALAGTEASPGLLERYCFLLSETEEPMIRDIGFKPEWKIGDRYCNMYALSDVEDMPAVCGSKMVYDKYSTDKTRFPIGFAAPIGQLLTCDHIYNQVIIIEDTQKTIKLLESKRRRLQSLAAYSRENTYSMEATNAFLNEAVSEQRQPVKAHFNLIVWTEDREQLGELRNQVSAAIAQMDGTPRQEVHGAPQVFWACLPGNAADCPVNDTFDTFAEQAICFLNMETAYRSASPQDGIRFSDRLSGRPVFVDLYNGPRKAGITSNMGTLVCGTSGGGKSMTVNHILRTLFDQGAHCVTVDIGGSYKGLCELLKGYYFTYEESNPIKFNPFYLSEGATLDTEKKESLKSLLVALWKQDNENFNRSEYVALSNALQGYYLHLEKFPEIFPCFNSFYEYLETIYTQELKAFNVKDRDFDVNNFLYVLRPFYKGGEFDYLLNATEKLDAFNQPFVVFELDNVKDHPILFPVITLIIMELFISKMRKLKGVRKVLTIDEAWKAIAKSGMAEFLKYAFKTIRKFNGVPIVITQELDDLISSPIIKDAIINNADIKILMDMRKFVNKFDKLQDVLGMSEKGKNILLSVNKDNREIFIDIGGQIMKVYKNELCPEEYFSYTTEGRERVMVLDYAERMGSMEAGIEQLIKDRKSA
ncbi:TraG family conjugative transposon ATPase [Chitinophaga sp. 212800010-3]|uniref:TraG family conjugative transposon ATPase n=1 Tax=unclassified Chitinophaga TaxID=2619133 RepID=UPI002DE6D812|nr:TraG family conjugative transposon ATPase [Chitinophaga sp. 212800010-3]